MAWFPFPDGHTVSFRADGLVYTSRKSKQGEKRGELRQQHSLVYRMLVRLPKTVSSSYLTVQRARS